VSQSNSDPSKANPRYVLVKFEDGTPLLIEIDEDEGTILQPSPGGSGFEERTLASSNFGKTLEANFETVTKAVKNVAEQLRCALRNVAPDETKVELKFDVKLDSGILVAALAKGEASAGIKIELKWKQPRAAAS
jgi:hypothetical protein